MKLISWLTIIIIVVVVIGGVVVIAVHLPKPECPACRDSLLTVLGISQIILGAVLLSLVNKATAPKNTSFSR